MKKLLTIKYFSGFLIGILLVHVVYAFCLSKITAYLYPHRMLNIQKFESMALKYTNWRTVILSFLESSKKNASKPIILIIGSSFSWGYPWQEDKIHSHRLQELLKDNKIINISTIGASPNACWYILSAMKKLNFKVSKIVIEANLLNVYTTSPVSIEIFERMKFLEDINVFFPPYMLLYLTNFFGFDAYKIIQDEYNYKQAELVFSKGNLTKEHFQTMDEFNKTLSFSKESFDKIFDLATMLADEVYFVTAPLARDGIPDVVNLDVLAKQMAIINQLCHENKCIHCENLGIDNHKENFMDMSHLNQRGHKIYSEHLFKILNTAMEMKDQHRQSISK